MRYRVGVLIALTSAAIGIAGVSPSHAACAAPTLSANPNTGQAGTQVTVEGRFFTEECRDTGQTEPSPPRRNIDIVFEQAGTSTVLARVDANDEYTFSVEVTIPIGAQSGAATLTARQDDYNDVAAGFTVQETSTSQAQPPRRELPRTGPVTAETAMIGTGTVLLGLLLVCVGGRRRCRSTGPLGHR